MNLVRSFLINYLILAISSTNRNLRILFSWLDMQIHNFNLYSANLIANQDQIISPEPASAIVITFAVIMI